MCIKLTRHFQCSATAQHTCEYLVRCSNPMITFEEAMLGEAKPQHPCFADLETQDEWYDEPCPDCTGEIVVPKTEPTRVEARVSDIDADDLIFAHLAAMDRNSIVSVYTESLAYLLFAYVYNGALEDEDPLLYGQDETDISMARMERETCLLTELICWEQPEHGSGCRLTATVQEDVVPNDGSQTWTGSEVLVERECCDCFSMRRPIMTNMALGLRRIFADEAYLRFADPQQLLLGMAPMAREHVPGLLASISGQRSFEEKIAKLQKTIMERNKMSPVLTALHTPEEVIHQRHTLLARHSRWLITLRQNGPANHGVDNATEMGRYDARASLAGLACVLLAHDHGLSLARARAILTCFVARVVPYDPEWEDYEPQACNTRDASKRLAHAANHHPRLVMSLVSGTLVDDRFDGGFIRRTELLFTNWVQANREQTAIIRDNVVAASDAELAALRERGETTCHICFDEFAEHAGGAVVQNRACHTRGHNHWFGMACLVRSARVFPSSYPSSSRSAPSLRCPICRTDFMPAN